MRVCSFDLPGVKVLQLELLWALYCFQINYGMRKNISGVTKKKKKSSRGNESGLLVTLGVLEN